MGYKGAEQLLFTATNDLQRESGASAEDEDLDVTNSYKETQGIPGASSNLGVCQLG